MGSCENQMRMHMGNCLMLGTHVKYYGYMVMFVSTLRVRAMSYLSSLAEHLEENLEQSSSSIIIYCMGD